MDLLLKGISMVHLALLILFLLNSYCLAEEPVSVKVNGESLDQQKVIKDALAPLDTSVEFGSELPLNKLPVTQNFYCGLAEIAPILDEAVQRPINESQAKNLAVRLQETMMNMIGQGSDKSAAEIFVPAVASVSAFWMHLSPLAPDVRSAVAGTVVYAATLLYFLAKEKALKEQWSKSTLYNVHYANWWAIRKTVALALLLGLSADLLHGQIAVSFEGVFLVNLMLSPVVNALQAIRNKWPRVGKVLQSFGWHTLMGPQIANTLLAAFASLDFASIEHAEFVISALVGGILTSYGAALVRRTIHSENRLPLAHESFLKIADHAHTRALGLWQQLSRIGHDERNRKNLIQHEVQEFECEVTKKC